MEEHLSPYNQALLKHYKQPFKKLGNLGQSHSAHVENTLCGDSIDVYFDIDDSGFITNFSFEAKACMIVIATASLVGEWIEGKTVDSIYELRNQFERLIDDPEFESTESWGVLKEIQKYPTRRKCVELPLKALLLAQN